MAEEPSVYQWAVGLSARGAIAVARGAIAVPTPAARIGPGRRTLQPPLLPARTRQPSPELEEAAEPQVVAQAALGTGHNKGNRAAVGTSDSAWVRESGARGTDWEQEPWAVGWLAPCEGNSARAHCKACDTGLEAQFSTLNVHAGRPKHLAAAAARAAAPPPPPPRAGVSANLPALLAACTLAEDRRKMLQFVAMADTMINGRPMTEYESEHAMFLMLQKLKILSKEAVSAAWKEAVDRGRYNKSFT
ncbi:hypothetical protein FOA52_011144 [Chlamydomonas sp. UWO 241]|nr:hypothetical protein FOA52_011144 [Chlamydomonas sp. UWO 241]